MSSGVLNNVHLAVGVDVAVRSANIAKSVAHLGTGLQGLGVSEAGLISSSKKFSPLITKFLKILKYLFLVRNYVNCTYLSQNILSVILGVRNGGDRDGGGDGGSHGAGQAEGPCAVGGGVEVVLGGGNCHGGESGDDLRKNHTKI